MGERGKIRYRLTGSYTRRGYYSFAPRLVQEMKKIWIVTGPAGSGKSYFIRSLGEELAMKGYEVEFWLSAMESGGVEGVHLPQIKAVLVNASLLQTADGIYPDINGEIIDMSRGLKEECNRAGHQEAAAIEGLRLEHSRQARQLIEQAAKEEEFIAGENAKRVDEAGLTDLMEQIEESLFTCEPAAGKFFGTALTANGLVNYIQDATRNCRHRYILQGPPGCGQEQVIRRMAARAAENGCHHEIFARGSDPLKPCLLVLREPQAALIDWEDPPLAKQPGDVIIDMRQTLKEPGREFPDREDGRKQRGVDALLTQAQVELQEIYGLNRTLKRMRAAALDLDWVDKRRREIIGKIIHAGAPD